MISGPSFLGLNQPAPKTSSGSGNLDYLLQDEDEEPKSGGAGKYVLILFALILAAGLGYLRWRGQGFGWLGSSASTPAAATTPAADGSDSNAGTPSTPAASNAAPAAGTSPANAPTTGGTPANSSIQPNPPTANSSAVASGNAAIQPAPDSSAAAASPAPSAAAPSAAANPDDSASASADQAKEDQPTADQPKTAPAKRKPSASVEPKPVAAPPVDSIAEAQRYLYGKGVPQNCDRGLRMLKPQAERANSKAMIEMGALYSAGLCTPRDLPTAYRWFAMALRKDPNNQAVQTDLEKLWGEMTQPERQLAMKLSQ
jgi:hypothetical protein